MANLISEVREHTGLNHEQIGQELGGIHRTTVLRWENGDTPITGPAKVLLGQMLKAKRKRAGRAA